MLRPSLGRRVTAEFLGSAFLVLAVVGSGIAAQRLSPNDVGLQLLENTLATVFALAALLLALGPISGAHLNPIVSLVEASAGRLLRRDVGPYFWAQVVGAACGAGLANVLYGHPAFEIATTDRSALRLVLSEAVATFGLLAVIRGVSSSPSPKATPFAVAAYIGGAYWFTSSTSFANPAVTLARMLSDSFAGIAPASVPGFLVGQVVGGLLGAVACAKLFGAPRVPEVLFVCVHNAGRSQMAAAFLEAKAKGGVRVRSAGSAPGERVNPVAVAVMTERGIDLANEIPKRLSDDGVRAADIVITMGCGDACPVFPGKSYEDWVLEDPAGKDLATVRRIRDEIEHRIDDLLGRLRIEPR